MQNEKQQTNNKKKKKLTLKERLKNAKPLLKVFNVISYILSLIFIITIIYGCATYKAPSTTNRTYGALSEVVADNNYNNDNYSKSYYVVNNNNSYSLDYNESNDINFWYGLFESYNLNSSAWVALDGNITFDTLIVNRQTKTNWVQNYISLDTRSTNYCIYKLGYGTFGGFYFVFYYDNLGSVSYMSVNHVGTNNNDSSGSTYQSTICLTTLNLTGNTQLQYISDYFSSSGGYTEEDLNNAYEEGYNYGIEVAYNDITHDNYNLIRFNEYFDWRILLSRQIDTHTGLFITSSSKSNIQYLEGLTFSSNGKTYNRILLSLSYVNDLASTYIAYNNEPQNTYNLNDTFARLASDVFGSSLPSGNSLTCLLGVAYQYYDYDNDTISYGDFVYSGYEANVLVQSVQEGFNWYPLRSVNQYNLQQWTNDAYKTLVIINDSGTPCNSDYYPQTSLYTLLTANADVRIQGDIINYTDLFTLLAGGFSAIGVVFNMSFLPNITLGTLLFLPLLVIMFITIVKLLKK